jgi:hypothetical protein
VLLSCGAANQVRSFIDQVKNLPDTFKIDISPRNFRLIVTDAPDAYTYLSSASITISKIEIKSSAGQLTNLLDEEKSFDLAALRNGKYITLAEVDIPENEYFELKIYFTKASIRTTSGVDYALQVPLGAQEGVTIPILEKAIPSSTNKEIVVLDIDLGKSILLNGNLSTVSGVTGADFFPVMRAANFNNTGHAAGKIILVKGNPPKPSSEGIGGVKVTISQGSISTTAFTEEDGTFAVLGLGLGEYKITTYKEGYVAIPNQTFRISEVGINVIGTGMSKTSP